MKAAESTRLLSSRRYELDWIRTLTVLLVLPFHALLIFVQNPGAVVYMKDSLDCVMCDRMAGFMAEWQMQILSIIAGMSTAFALSKRGAGKYLLERVVRLLVPFLFGVVTVVPAMTYITQIGKGKEISFWQHYATFFTLGEDLAGVSGTFTPAHLWFILFLFLFSIIALPLFLLLRSERSQGALRGMAWLLEKPLALLLLGLPMALAWQIDLLGAQNPVYYIIVFITGYILATDARYQKAVARDWPLMLLLGAILEIMRQTGQPFTIDNTPARALRDVVIEFNSWVWSLAILGMGQKVLNFGGRTLTYLSEASYPFYILHLLVLTVVTFYAVRFHAPVAVKYAVIVAISYAVTFLAYEVSRRVPPLRFLLGMKGHSGERQEKRKRALVRA